ncbi:ROK family protein [Cellulomonas sp. URHE0023]|uniref:ROK family transcriptional regulator n=1 Tax=Cellulomonas sp. URHE0023 TaxID=1380354 RepID=UPI0005554F30|nr:ROK family protein [Cellulomonas sp. URHE0023]
MARTTTPGTPALMRAINDRAGLEILLDRQPLSRIQLAELSSVSKPTASQMVRRLENAGLVTTVGKVSSTSGPATSLYGVRADRVLGVAIDVRADRSLARVVDAVGGDHPTAETARAVGTAATAGAELRAAVEAACQAADVDVDSVQAISVGLQASVSPRDDRLYLPHRLDFWPTTGTRALLEAELGWAVELHNDANLAAVAERAAGAGRGAESFALLWLGGGLGFAVDIGGRILNGSRGAAGEIGQLRLPGEAIGQGGAVVLDDALDRSVLVAMADRHGIRAAPGELADALRDHPARIGLFAELAPRVALAIPSALAVLDPELVILGGPIGAAGGTLLASLVEECVAREVGSTPTVVCAGVTDDPVLAGARHLLTGVIRSRLLDAAGSHVPG